MAQHQRNLFHWKISIPFLLLSLWPGSSRCRHIFRWHTFTRCWKRNLPPTDGCLRRGEITCLLFQAGTHSQCCIFKKPSWWCEKKVRWNTGLMMRRQTWLRIRLDYRCTIFRRNSNSDLSLFCHLRDNVLFRGSHRPTLKSLKEEISCCLSASNLLCTLVTGISRTDLKEHNQKFYLLYVCSVWANTTDTTGGIKSYNWHLKIVVETITCRTLSWTFLLKIFAKSSSKY